ncbi:LuxR family transcriptional regulator [Lentzea tibetensis]|uniref:LuxR family transcriptional regulator n=1 Tax=Lentzea tibetensis TaxID=2591470 RepID=A0A563F2H8_9PSEU|nr:LuxR C-terminal-related transcriptional regulator [Lentzea tibetensis]TWP54165.1 LuxR family transcriptional regulator [Lentzea tibetensis]
MSSASGERCEVCGEDLVAPSNGRRTGRPARYCSSACRQRAYRMRPKDPGPALDGPPAPLKEPVLPAPLDSFVGRERDLAELDSLLRKHRLVTLLGPGGAGKTRLSVELGTRVRDRFPGGVYLVELASLTDPALIARTVADTLGAGEEIGRPVVETLADAVSRQPALLVLDNCEHLVVAAARLTAELLRRSAALTVVVTSRESLELPGEVVFRVGELTLPANAVHAVDLLSSDAVRLFVERASANSPDFELTDDNAAHVAAICAELDGLPLAIELAARRVRLLGVAEIRSRLADRFQLLTSGPRTAARRHRDLRTTIEWSYELLDPVEQVVFRSLSVLVGGFNMDTAAAVSDVDDVLEPLSALESRSLVVAGRADGRFRQLESIRLYGFDQLRAAGEEDETYDRLAEYLLALAEPIVGDGMLHCYEELAPLDAERTNLLALLDWAAQHGDDRHLALATALGRVWRHHGYVSDGSAMLLSAIDTAGRDHPVRWAALTVAAGLVIAGGDYPLAVELASEAVRLCEVAGHPVRLVKALSILAAVYVTSGMHDAGREVAQRALDQAPRLTNPLDLSVCLHNQAYYLLLAGQVEQATELMDRCLPLYRAHSPHPLPSEWLHTAGVLALARDDVDAADTHLRESLERFVTTVGADSLPVTAVESFDGLAIVAVRQGLYVRAVRLDTIADVARHDRKLGREASVESKRDATLAVARGGLTPEEVRRAEYDGMALARRGAVEYAISDTWPEREGSLSPLSDQEISVARMVAAGHTNRQIASRLRLTERAVESRLRDIRTTLGLRTRAQLAAWSAQHLDEP